MQVPSTFTRVLPTQLVAVRSVRPQRAAACRASAEEVTGVVFQPFEEAQTELTAVSKAAPSDSFGRVKYNPALESAMNEQINVELTNSHVYHALHSFMGRDNVGLPGFAAFFNQESLEERSHAQMLIDYQNERGGRVQLKALAPPLMEFDHEEKGEALYAMELGLSLEKLNFQKLLQLYSVAEESQDPAATHFLDSMLEEQTKDIKEYAEYVSQLRRVGKGLGVYEFDRQLAEATA